MPVLRCNWNPLYLSKSPLRGCLKSPDSRQILLSMCSLQLPDGWMKPIPHSVNLELAGLFKHPLKKKARVLENSVVAPVLPDYSGVALMVREHDHGC
jgi:hypothetical protein